MRDRVGSASLNKEWEAPEGTGQAFTAIVHELVRVRVKTSLGIQLFTRVTRRREGGADTWNRLDIDHKACSDLEFHDQSGVNGHKDVL